MFAFTPKIVVALTALSTLASAASVSRPIGKIPGGNFAATNLGSKCSVTTAPTLTSGISTPAGSVSMVALGVGVQNYTCSSTGTYTSTGAVAELFDASCFVSQSFFSQASPIAFELWNSSTNVQTTDVIKMFSTSPENFGQHYFATVNGVLSPVFDARAGEDAGDPNGYAVMAKTATVAAPTGAGDVAWLSLTNAGEGDLAQNILRIATTAGQPPATCAAGTPDISVKYVAQYWFFK